jgi:peptide/nickel transport system permease protein
MGSRFALAILLVAHGVILFAEFFAPYDFAIQRRQFAFAPPNRIHFIDADGRFHLRPFVYPWAALSDASSQYQENRAVRYPIHFFVSGSRYQLFGCFNSTIHLFGVAEPALFFLMGSDENGRDQFSRLLYGSRISLFAGLTATALSVLLGIVVGLLAGYYGGWLDQLLMRATELFLALPWLYMLFAVRAILPLHLDPGRVFLLLIAILGFLGWARPARLIRGVVLSVRQREYVLAAKGFGGSDFYILHRHILPQISGVALSQAAIFIPQYILAEVALSFVGIGVSEPVPSLGNMLAVLQHFYVLDSYWWMFLPALVLILVLFAYYSIYLTSGSTSVKSYTFR